MGPLCIGRGGLCSWRLRLGSGSQLFHQKPWLPELILAYGRCDRALRHAAPFDLPPVCLGKRETYLGILLNSFGALPV